MRTEVEKKTLRDLEKYKVVTLSCDSSVTEMWVRHILDHGALPRVVVWKDTVIVGVNIVNVIKNIGIFSLERYEIRKVKECDVEVIVVTGGSYQEALIYKYM